MNMAIDFYKNTEYFECTQPDIVGRHDTADSYDYAFRAISIIENVSWLEAFDMLTAVAREMLESPHSPHVYEALLSRKGYKTTIVKGKPGEDRMTAEEFALSHPNGKFLLRLSNYLCAVIDGKIRNTYNCGNAIVYTIYEL